MYGYCPSWALNWEYRKKGIIDEIRQGAADIISLQVRAPVYRSERLVLQQLFSYGHQFTGLNDWFSSSYLAMGTSLQV
jgi:mRNA deadenylase 3'-5' endonuclease subunit Ccr4